MPNVRIWRSDVIKDTNVCLLAKFGFGLLEQPSKSYGDAEVCGDIQEESHVDYDRLSYFMQKENHFSKQ